MCGVCGIYTFSGRQKGQVGKISSALKTLRNRGPEVQAHYVSEPVVLGHSRLSIIDTSSAANQPLSDDTGNYTIVFNGEIYNFRQLRTHLEAKGISFRTQSDTEVLLHWIIKYGAEGIEQLQGFFAFAVYNKVEKTLLLARDRFGIKPLLYFADNDQMIFASEMKAMIAMGIPREIDYASLQAFFQLNFIPGQWSIYANVLKLAPGHYLTAKPEGIEIARYYEIPKPIIENVSALSYSDAMARLKNKLEEAVVKRLVSDVPLGAFLSGGIDSSIIVALASRHVAKLNTFSIGFRDEPMFDETRFANLVARMHNTNHTVFSLTTNDLFECLQDVLDYTDELFADSSALAVFILSRETRKKVTVALSGDGADELFAGYNKHMAEWRVKNAGLLAKSLGLAYPFLELLPRSRNSFLSNKIRQLHRFGAGMNLSPTDRYWRWATYADEGYVSDLLLHCTIDEKYLQRKAHWTRFVGNGGSINNTLYNDMHLVLPDDMLVKVDMMSMANSLEVRVPFLDHEVVNFAFSLPEDFKINKLMRKRILKDAFRQDLPPELYHRPKQGFEVPLLNWFRTELKDKIINYWLDEKFIQEQNIFNPKVINNLKAHLFSRNPGEIHAQMWALIVFQNWYSKYHI